MARCPNYSHATAERFLEALKWGATEGEALAYAGLDVMTLRTWRRRRPEFASKMDRMLASNIGTEVDRVRDEAKGGGYGEDYVPPNWRASVWLATRQAAGMEISRLRELTTDAV